MKRVSPAAAMSGEIRKLFPPGGTLTQSVVARVGAIDGIRGWAALVVLLFHVFWETFGVIVPEFRSDHLRFVLAGPLAVSVFFVLSGDALATPFLQTGRIEIVIATAVRRYFRLAIPVLMICTVVYLLMVLKLTPNGEAGRILAPKSWLGSFLNFQAAFLEMVSFATFDVFASTAPRHSYNAFLWTMPIEMLGSALVFLFLFVTRAIRKPLIVATALAAFLLMQASYLGLFFVGVCLAQLRCRGFFAKLHRSDVAQRGSAYLLLLLYLVFCYGLYGYNTPVVLMFIAGAVVSLIYTNRLACKFFENRVSSFLGYVSFPLYLVHFAVLTSFTSSGILYLHSVGHLDFPATLALGLASVVISLAAAFVFGKLETRLLSNINQWLSRHVLTIVPAQGGSGLPRLSSTGADSLLGHGGGLEH